MPFGRTPIVRVNRVVPDGLELYVKVEWYGPTGSVKDRITGRCSAARRNAAT